MLSTISHNSWQSAGVAEALLEWSGHPNFLACNIRFLEQETSFKTGLACYIVVFCNVACNLNCTCVATYKTSHLIIEKMHAC